MWVKLTLNHSCFGKIGVDKATWKHRTIEMLTFQTVIPDFEEVMQAIYLCAPVIIGCKGIDISRNFSDVLNSYNITAQ